MPDRTPAEVLEEADGSVAVIVETENGVDGQLAAGGVEPTAAHGRLLGVHIATLAEILDASPRETAQFALKQLYTMEADGVGLFEDDL